MSNITSTTYTSISFQAIDSTPSPVLVLDGTPGLPFVGTGGDDETSSLAGTTRAASVLAFNVSDYSSGNDTLQGKIAPPFSMVQSVRHLDSYLMDGTTSMRDTADSISEFEVNDSIYFQLLSPPDAYTVHSTAGAASISAHNIPYAMSETLNFSQSSSAFLAHEPHGSVIWQWEGNSPGPLLFIGREVRIQGVEKAIGTLKVDYLTLCDRLRLVTRTADFYVQSSSGTIQLDELSVAVSVLDEDSAIVASINVTVQLSIAGVGSVDDDEGNPLVAVNLKVLDFCSDAEIEGAHVWLDGVDKGTSDEFGIVSLGNLGATTTHQLKITKAGYIDSDDDVLYNDEFTVPEADEEESL